MKLLLSFTLLLLTFKSFSQPNTTSSEYIHQFEQAVADCNNAIANNPSWSQTITENYYQVNQYNGVTSVTQNVYSTLPASQRFLGYSFTSSTSEAAIECNNYMLASSWYSYLQSVRFNSTDDTDRFDGYQGGIDAVCGPQF